MAYQPRRGTRVRSVLTVGSTTPGALRRIEAVDAYPFLTCSSGSVTDVLRVSARLRRIVREHARAGKPVRA